MKKKLLAVLGLSFLIAITACEPTIESSSSSTSSFEYKSSDGVAAIFDEEMGFYNTAATILQLDETTRLVYYTTNENKNVADDVIAFRKGTLVDGEYVYEDRQIVLTPSENSWDSVRVNNADVVKGEFKYNDTTYNYLMAYSGNAIEAEKQYQVGLAVSVLPEGPWVKVGDQPFIEYDPVVYGSTYGAASPSLVSYNNKGQVRLFVTFADTNLTGTRVYDLDLSDLNNVIGLDAHRYVSVLGLEDKDLGVHPMLNNADFAIDKETGNLYVVRDRNPLASTNPTVADSLQVAVADVKILNEITPSWEIIKNISDRDTVNEDDSKSLGWSRIYSGSFLTDAYGHLLDSSEITVVYTSSLVASSISDETYRFSPAIHLYNLKVN